MQHLLIVVDDVNEQIQTEDERTNGWVGFVYLCVYDIYVYCGVCVCVCACYVCVCVRVCVLVCLRETCLSTSEYQSECI